MSFVHAGAFPKCRSMLAAFLFALPACFMAADQSALLGPDSNLPQHKDFLKQLSAKDLLNQPTPPPLEKGGPPTFFVDPQTPGPEKPSAITPWNTPTCSIPLLEKPAGTNPDPNGVIKVPPPSFDGIIGRNPAPACKNWIEKNR